MTRSKTIQEPTRAGVRRAELAEAEQRFELANGFQAEALAARAKFEAAKRAGDLDVTPAQDIETKNAVQHWADLVATHQQNVIFATRRLLPDAPELGEAIAFNLGNWFSGITAEVVEQIPALDMSNPVPRLVVRQIGMHEQSGGAVSGRVEIAIVGPGYVQPIDEQALARHLESVGARLELQGRALGVARSFTFGVTAWPEWPIIESAPTDRAVNTFAEVVAREIVDRSYSSTFRGNTIVATGSGRVVSTGLADGQQLTVGEIEVQVRPAMDSRRDTWLSPVEASQAARSRLMALAGRVVPNVGRIDGVGAGDGGTTARITVRGRVG